jgi:beta-glucosidase
MGAGLTSGAAEKGFALCPKHFAFNDQETNRSGLATFMNEQEARENMLRAFEGAFAIGNAKGTMTTFARIGTTYGSAEYDLMTGVLVTEWGSHAFSITDTLSGSTNKAWGYMEGPESLLAGTAFMDSNTTDGFCEGYTAALSGPLAGTDYENSTEKSTGTVSATVIKADKMLAYGCRVAAKKTLYQFINSAAMNGVTPNSRIVKVTPWWQPAIVVVDVVFGVAAAACAVFVGLEIAKSKKN